MANAAGLCFIDTSGEVSLADMGDFVSHDRSKLCLTVSVQKQAGIHSDNASGRGKRIDLLTVDDHK